MTVCRANRSHCGEYVRHCVESTHTNMLCSSDIFLFNVLFLFTLQFDLQPVD